MHLPIQLEQQDRIQVCKNSSYNQNELMRVPTPVLVIIPSLQIIIWISFADLQILAYEDLSLVENHSFREYLIMYEDSFFKIQGYLI